MFVVVQLIEAKKRIIIPESFIFDLHEESLKNMGCNSNHRYLIYWSKDALDDEKTVPDANCTPKFDLPLSKDYPPQNDVIETCYHAQLKHFFGKFIN